MFSSLYGLRSSVSTSLSFEYFNCLTLSVPESDIHVKVNVFFNVPDVIETEREESLKYKRIAQKSVTCVVQATSTCEKLYDQLAAELQKSKNEIDLVLCCRDSKVRVGFFVE